MKYLSTVLLVLVLLAPASYAQPLQFPRPPQAPAAKKAKAEPCPCTGKSDCTCDPAACFCRACSGRKVANYTGTLNLAHTLPAGSHGWGLLYSVITDTDIPAGTYTLTAVPKATTRVHCYCGNDPLLCSCTQGECQCRNGKPCTMYPVPQKAMKCDTTIIYRCPETGCRWHYVDQQGNWSVVPELPPVQYQPQFVPMSFGGGFSGGGGVRGGSC